MVDSTIKPLLAGPALTACGFAILILPLGLHTFGEPILFMKVDVPVLVVSVVLSTVGLILGPTLALRQHRAPGAAAGSPSKRLWALSMVSAFGLSLLALPLGLYLGFWGMAYRLL